MVFFNRNTTALEQIYIIFFGIIYLSVELYTIVLFLCNDDTGNYLR